MTPEPTPESVAEECGIELDRAPVDRVPVRPVRETGTVTKVGPRSGFELERLML